LRSGYVGWIIQENGGKVGSIARRRQIRIVDVSALGRARKARLGRPAALGARGDE
jgi:hypothetical protein